MTESVRLHRAAVAALLGLFVVCGSVSLRGDSATFDETPHLGAGVSYLETGDFRLNPEHPPLAKLVAAVPLVVSGRGGGDYRSRAWTGPADEWVFGFDLINGPPELEARRDPAARLTPARTAMLALGALLCLVVYGWARELWGPHAGLLALGLAAICPTILAHARLVTTDAPGALGILATAWAFWRYTRSPSLLRASVTGVALGAAFLFKFNTVVLAPIIVLLAAVAVASRRLTVKQAATAILAAGAIGYAAIWAGYGLRYAASPDGSHALPWASVTEGAPLSPPVALAREHRLLPEAYLYGLAYAKAQAKGRTAFLDGEESNAGFYRYFPEAFLFKTPPAFLILAGWVIAAGVRRSGGRSFDGWCLALPPLALSAVAIVSRFNIGHRHIAFVYPFLYIAVAPAAAWILERGRRRVAVLALLAGCVLSFALATPRYLSYVNVLGGGSRAGWRHFADSSIDWGQDLRRLKRWMDAEGVEEIGLAYFGTADPRAYGIRFRKVALFLDYYQDVPQSLPRRGETLAASVALLHGLFLGTDRAFLIETVRHGWVSRQQAEEYLADRQARTDRGQPVRHAAPWMIERGLITREQAREIEDGLPGGWLARARDTWTPIGRAGDSILIYRVE
jgi:hypothetical protein